GGSGNITTTEAGISRRAALVPGDDAWFEFAVDLPAGQPFGARIVETYSGPADTNYLVYANGVLIHERTHSYTGGGAGVVEYTIAVDDAAIAADGSVVIRFEA